MRTISLQLLGLVFAPLALGQQTDSRNTPFSPGPTSSPVRGLRSPAFNNSSSGVVRSGVTDSTSPLSRSTAPALRDPPAIRRNAASDDSTRLLQESLTLARRDIDGQQTPLVEVLERSPGQAQRTRAVQAYWQLSAAISEYGFARDEEQLLKKASPRRLEIEEKLLAAAIAEAAARTQEAKVAVIGRQQGLLAEASMPATSQLPWPSDAPFIGPYRTKFQNLFAGQPQPIRLQQIDQVLPHMLTRIDAHAEALLRQQEALLSVFQAYQQDQVELSLLLRTHEKLFRQRRSFLKAVLEYNHQIADYAVTVAGPSTPADVLISTLIPVPPSARAAARGFIRRTSAEQPLESQSGQPVFREVQLEDGRIIR